MSFPLQLDADDEHVLDLCTKHLARLDEARRHSHKGYLADDPRGRFSEGWRYPLIESDETDDTNRVTFVWRREMDEPRPQAVALCGTFAPLYARLPLREIPDSIYWYVTLRIGKRECHRYLFLVDGTWRTDRVNPQEEKDDSGDVWSRFFTERAIKPLTLQPHERALLGRFVQHILPFRSHAAEEFLRAPGGPLPTHIQVLDEAVGVVNFIDKVLAREERHNKIDYDLCLREIERLLRLRDSTRDPDKAGKGVFTQLYNEMMAGEEGEVPGWNRNVYRNPKHFLRMVRRHTFLGAFAHPKYGGNADAMGWRFLAETFRDPQNGNVFTWQRAIEPPLGSSPDYRG